MDNWQRATVKVRSIVWCKEVEPDRAEMAARHGDQTAVPDWRERLVCSQCGSREIDMVARVKCARGPLLPPLPVHSSDP
jgi:hypothetical protein